MTSHVMFTSPNKELDGWIGKKCVITMELMAADLDGGSETIQALPAKEKAAFVRALVSKMNAMHAVGYAHGDIKSANVMYKDVDGTLIPFLVDFGGATQGYNQYAILQDNESMRSLVETLASGDKERASLIGLLERIIGVSGG